MRKNQRKLHFLKKSKIYFRYMKRAFIKLDESSISYFWMNENYNVVFET